MAAGSLTGPHRPRPGRFRRPATVVAACSLALAVATTACGLGGSAVEPESIPVDDGTYASVAQRGGPRVDRTGTYQAPEPVVLAVEQAGADHPEPYVPVAARGSALAHRAGERHVEEPVALAYERAHGVIVEKPVAAARAMASPAVPAMPPRPGQSVAASPAPAIGQVATASPAASPVPAADVEPWPNAQDVAIVTGTVERLDGHTVVVATADGPRSLRLADDARIEQDGAGSAADLRPGEFVGLVHQPGGPASSGRIFSRGPGMPRPGVAALVGNRQGQVTTFGTIVARLSDGVVLQTGGETTSVRVASNVDVTRPAPATNADVRPGQAVLAAGTLSPDGAVTANRLRLSADRALALR